MSNSRGKTGDLEKRLEAVKDAVRWVGGAHCTAAYNYFLSFLRGEDRKSYADYWKPKINSPHNDIEDAPTLDEAMKLVARFCVDISAYTLHGKGFYEAGLSLEEVQTHAERIRTMLTKLFRLLPGES